MRKVRENVLVSSGNQSLFPADTPVFTSDLDGTSLNGVIEGQIVIYDYTTGVAVGPGTTTDDVDRIVIAVGHDTNADGVADVLLKPFGDRIFGCNIQAATAEPPRCGVPNIQDLYYNCVQCDEDFAINVTVEDDITQNQYPFNRPANYNFSVKTDCCGCDTCETGIDCVKLTDKFISQINATTTKNKKSSLPFSAVKIFGGHARASIDYCLDPVVGACADCIAIDAITGISFTHPINGETTVTFTGTTTPGDAATSLQAQLPKIVSQINKALGIYGSAVVTSSLTGTGKPCCAYQLQVNTSVPDFELLGEEDAIIEECAVADPFEGTGFTCGIRFISKPIDISCDSSLAPGTPRGYLGRALKVYPVSGFSCGASLTKEIQKEQLPENLGYEWQTREVSSSYGGSGRDHNPWGYDPHGRWGAPLGNSRGYSAKAVCKETYCSYILEHSLPNTDVTVHGHSNAARGRTVILIPSGDNVTRTEFEAIINPYLSSTKCPVKATITCASDQDQVEMTLTEGGVVDQPAYSNTGGGFIL